jgi:signal transduction histidine kinase/FixJ family two-component response regulator
LATDKSIEQLGTEIEDPSQLTRRVLVVDDSAQIRFLLRSILEKAGYSVEEAQDGPACVNACKSNKPDLVLLDVMMPGTDGILICKDLRKKFSAEDLPIIIVTARCEGEDVAQGLGAGANDYVFKPVDRRSLLARVSNQFMLTSSLRRLAEQRRVLERALKVQNALGDVLPEAIVVHDAQGWVLYANHQLLKACGRPYYDDEALHIHELFSMVYGGALNTHCNQCWEQAKLSPLFNSEEEVHFFAGRAQSVQVLTAPIVVDKDSILRLWIWRDISEMRELERRSMQEGKLNMVSLFAAGVAHNFNNLLGGVIGATQVLARLTNGNSSAERCIRVLNQSVEAGSKLTKRLTGLVSGANDSEISLGIALETVLSIHREQAGEALEWVQEIEPETADLRFPFLSLSAVLSDIVCNAVEACAGTGTIRIEAKLHAEQTSLLIKVSDTGGGMSPEVQQKIFEPFFSTKSLDVVNGVSIEGRGLGLWRVYSIIRSVGGDVQIESTPGKGTCVCLRLPLPEKAAATPGSEEKRHVPV